MKNKMDNSIFFLTLSFVCIWLIVDVAAGKDYLGSFLGTLFPSIFRNGNEYYVNGEYVGTVGEDGAVYNDDGTRLGVYDPETGRWDRGEFTGGNGFGSETNRGNGFGAENSAPNSSAKGQSDRITTTTPNTVPYGTTR